MRMSVGVDEDDTKQATRAQEVSGSVGRPLVTVPCRRPSLVLKNSSGWLEEIVAALRPQPGRAAASTRW
jgi:hypothetical protein